MYGPTLTADPPHTVEPHHPRPGGSAHAEPTPPASTEPTPPPDTEPAPPPDAGPAQRHVVATAVVVALGMLLSIMNSAIVGIDYSEITKEIGGSQVDVQWVTNAYRAASGFVIPVAAWLCNRYGLRRMFLLSMLLYALFSTVCGLAEDLPFLIVSRVLQSIPGSMTPVICLLIFYKIVPKERMAVILSVYVMVVISGVGFAPLIGGFLGQHASWRMIFFVVVPIALVGLAAGAFLLPAMPGRRELRFDPLGFLTAGVALATVQIAVAKGSDWGWTSYPVLLLLAVGLDALALFVYVELRVREPLLNLRVFRNAPFVMAAVLMDVVFTGVFLALSFVPTFLASAQQITPTNVGLLMLPQGLAWMLVTPLAIYLFTHYGPKLPAAIGLLLVGVGTLLLVRINVDLPRTELAVWLSLRSLGLGLVAVAILGGSVATLAPELMPDALSIRLVFQRVASGIGVALFTALVTARRAQVHSSDALLLSPDRVANDPRITRMQDQGAGGLTSLWQQLQNHAMAQAYSDVFLISGVLTLLCIAGVLLLRWGPAPAPRS